MVVKVSSRRKLLPWLRALCVLVALGVLFLVFRKVNLREMWSAMRTARPGWLVAAILIYGFGFVPAAWRWHLTLRLTNCDVDLAATARVTLIGHFFYTIFFGMAGGDFAKSALYSRWYRRPMPEVLAAAPLDRLLGFCGLMGFTALAFGLAWAHGAFKNIEPSTTNLHWWWFGLIALILGLTGAALGRWARGSAIERSWRAFWTGARRLAGLGSVAWQGIFCAFLVQVSFAANLALSLQAVTHSPVPWGQLLWTFPVIAVISALPFNVAGVGLREGASLTLLGWYGVSPADAVAASLLTFVARLFWAVAGGLLLWYEQRERTLKISAQPGGVTADG